jgi:hypothetical protein
MLTEMAKLCARMQYEGSVIVVPTPRWQIQRQMVSTMYQYKVLSLPVFKLDKLLNRP